MWEPGVTTYLLELKAVYIGLRLLFNNERDIHNLLRIDNNTALACISGQGSTTSRSIPNGNWPDLGLVQSSESFPSRVIILRCETIMLLTRPLLDFP